MSMEFYLGLDKHTLATLVLRLSKQSNEWRSIAIALGWEPTPITSDDSEEQTEVGA